MFHVIPRFLLCLILSAATVPAATIYYEAVNLADATPGQDLWQYRYWVSGYNLQANDGFTIWFDPALASSLFTPAAPGPNWHVQVFEPDPSLPASGAFDALALVNSPSISDPFVVDFVRTTSAATAGSQAYDVNRFDANLSLVEQLDTGFTQPLPSGVVPEPATYTFVLFALLLGKVLARRGALK